MEFSVKTEADRMIERGATTKLIRHETLEGAVAQFIPPEVIAEPEGWKIGADDSGDGNEYSVSEFIELIRVHQTCWGVCKQDANEIHYWIGNYAILSDVVCLFAHEFGHLEPHLDDEELRAEAFCRVAVRAMNAVRETLGDAWIKEQLR